MREFIASNVWWVALILASALLVAHVLSIPSLQIDSTALVLLGIILLSPFASAIRKIRIGDIEAEIAPEEVAGVRKQVSEIQATAQERDVEQPKGEPPLIYKTVEHIRTTAESDAPLALMELRMEIENEVNRLARRILSDVRVQDRPQTLRKNLDRLLEAGALSPAVADSLRRVIDIANRAAHGEKIRTSDAISMIDAGTVLLEQIHWHAWDFADEETETIPIDQNQVELYRQAQYEVITVVPLVDNPQKKILIVNQDDLDHLLDGYNEYAEFIVSIRKLEEEVTR